jgi:hypothetical protein
MAMVTRGLVALVVASGCSFSPHAPPGKIRDADAMVDVSSRPTDGLPDAVVDALESTEPGGEDGEAGDAGEAGSDGPARDAEQTMEVTEIAEVPPPEWPICTAPGGGDLGTGLVVYLPLDDATSNPVIADRSANHIFTMVNNLEQGAAWVTGRFGDALSLAGGAGGGWIAVGGTPPSPALNKIVDGLTLSVWVKFSAGTPPPDGVLLARRAAGPRGYLQRISISAGTLRAELHTKNGSHADLSGNRPLPTDGKWMHLGVTYNDSGQGLELFVNGESFGKQQFALQFGPEETLLTMGAAEDAMAVAPEMTVIDRLAGKIDELAVYGRALSADQIKALACGARPEMTTMKIMARSP